MSTASFLVVVSVAAVVAATCLALAEVLDVPALYAPALLAIVAIFVTREFWTWQNDLRGWVTVAGALAIAIGLAFLVQRVGV